MKLLEAIEKRRSVREFSSRKVKWSDILEAIDAAARAPFAGSINNLKFIIVSNEKTKNEISKQCQQSWIATAPYIVIACSDETRLSSLYNFRGPIYSRQQSGAAIENFLLRITDLGLSSCWVGAYADELLKQILSIPEHINIEAVLPIGYAKSAKKTKEIKVSFEKMINWEKWGQSKKPNRFNDPSTKDHGFT